MTPIERLLSRLQGVRRSGDGFVARCPAHDDRKPSLSITEGDDGRVLLTCHAGCSTEQVLAALSLTWDDLFVERKEKQPTRRIAHAYDYTDADGHLLFQTVRFLPKDFRQRRPDDHGGWIWNLKGVHPELYRLPEVRDAIASDQIVFLVEGEKDADALHALGLTATCNPMGAGAWRDDYATALRGARLVIVPDNDEAGREHAEQVARSCHDVAGEVRILELPGLDAKADVSDWITAGGDAEALLALAAAAPLYTPAALTPEASADLLVIKPANQWLHEASVRPIPRMLFDELWFEGELCILFADTNVGKSILAVQIADACFAIGESHQRAEARYLKQIKTRSGEFLHGSENVVLCRVEKAHNFLGFVFEGYGSEAEHLKARTGSENAVLDAEIVALKEAEPALSNRQLARRLNTNHMRVGRVLARMSTEVEQRGTGVPPAGNGVPVDFEYED